MGIDFLGAHLAARSQLSHDPSSGSRSELRDGRFGRRQRQWPLSVVLFTSAGEWRVLCGCRMTRTRSVSSHWWRANLAVVNLESVAAPPMAVQVAAYGDSHARPTEAPHYHTSSPHFASIFHCRRQSVGGGGAHHSPRSEDERRRGEERLLCVCVFARSIAHAEADGTCDRRVCCAICASPSRLETWKRRSHNGLSQEALFVVQQSAVIGHVNVSLGAKRAPQQQQL